MEKLEPLGNNIKIYVDETYHFTTDTILLAHFSIPKKSDKAIDLGTGCGTIPLIWKRHDAAKEITAIDIQSDAIDLFNKSIEYNKLTGINTYVADIKKLPKEIVLSSFDVVVCNPPYKLEGSGIINPDSKKALINHEMSCNLDDICHQASRLLNFNGKFCLCQRPERLSDVIETLRKYELEPKRLRFVQQRKEKDPKLFLIEARYKGKAGFLSVEKTLLIEDEDGNFSEEMINIYGDYKL